MALYIELLIFAFVLLAFTIANRKPIIESVQRSLCRRGKLQDEGNQALVRHVSNGSEKSQYVRQAAQAGKPYYMTMGLKRLDFANWLTVDSEYMKEHTVRKELLDNALPTVVQCLPGTELACTEALSLVVDFLVSRYPETFMLDGSSHTLSIHNAATNETFSLVGIENPLELAARLAMEDFSILIKDPSDQQYHLMASATLFPVGWKLQDRIGGTMAALHTPVPQWKEKLSSPIDRYFDRISPTSTMERSNTFIQTTPHFHLPTPPPQPSTTSPSNNPDHQTPPPITPSSIMYRKERQTFRRLPQSQAILFTVHTYMKPITSLSSAELTDFVMQMRGWPEDTARYKGRDVWGEVVERYWSERCGDAPS